MQKNAFFPSTLKRHYFKERFFAVFSFGYSGHIVPLETGIISRPNLHICKFHRLPRPLGVPTPSPMFAKGDYRYLLSDF